MQKAADVQLSPLTLAVNVVIVTAQEEKLSTVRHWPTLI